MCYFGAEYTILSSGHFTSVFDYVKMSSYQSTTPIFARLCRVSAFKHVPLLQQISYSTARAQLKEAFSCAGFDASMYGFHSFRSGGASTALNQGLSVEKVMKHGRWASYAAFARYWEENKLTRAQVSHLK